RMEDRSFTNTEVLRCPFPLIAELQEGTPVYVDPETGYYVLTRYEDVAYVFAHPELYSNASMQAARKVAPEVGQRYAECGYSAAQILVSADPPVHGQSRALVDKVFTPAFVKGKEPYLAKLVDELIDGFIDRGRVDFLNEFAIKLPMFVIADQLGVPRSDGPQFKKWADCVIERFTPRLPVERHLALAAQLLPLHPSL